MSLPADLRAAYAEGSWDLFAGQFFGEWRSGYHVVEPFEIPKYWNRIICVDWGWSISPVPTFACYFIAVSPEGDCYVYHELHGGHRLPEWWADRIHEQVERDDKQLADYVRVIDPATFNNEPRWGKPVAEMFSDAGIDFTRANNDRLNGWMQLRNYLAWERDPEDLSLDLQRLLRQPKFFVFRDHAPNLVRTLPVLPADKNKPEDVDTDTEDHCADAIRYGLMTRPTLTKIPFSALSPEWKEAMLRAQRREQEREK
jgi:phage terminase large subunit